MGKELFKTTDALFAKIAEDFSSYSQAQIIDEGRFYKDVVYIINLLGIAWFREAEEFIQVKNYKADLPCDFELLDSAYRCDRVIYDHPDANEWSGIVMQSLSFDHYPETQIPDPHIPPSCPLGTDYWAQSKDQIFNRHEITVVKRDGIFCHYKNPVLLRIGNTQTKRYCHSKCDNVFSKEHDTISIDGNHIYTNFKEGHIYLSYHALPTDEDTQLPLIPNDEIIEKCIEYYIKKNIMENIWVNGDADVERKVPYFKNEYKEHLGQALYQTKLPTFQTMVNAIRIKRKYLNVYQINTQPH